MSELTKRILGIITEDGKKKLGVSEGIYLAMMLMKSIKQKMTHQTLLELVTSLGGQPGPWKYSGPKSNTLAKSNRYKDANIAKLWGETIHPRESVGRSKAPLPTIRTVTKTEIGELTKLLNK